MADGLLNKASIILTPTGYKAGTLYNVAPIDEPYEDFDFARASVASRVNSSGLVEMVGRTLGSELVTNGDFATDSDWNLGTGWSIGDGKASFNGGSDANIIQTNSDITIGNTFKITLDVSDMDNGELSVRLGGGASTEIARIQDNGSYVFYGVSISSNITFRALSSFNGSIDNVSVKEIIDTNNIPRISYDSNGDNGHILLEPTSTNILEYSEDFSQWILQDSASVSTESYTSPSGDNTAKLIDLSANSNARLVENFGNNSTTYTLSFYLKKHQDDSDGTFPIGYYNGTDYIKTYVNLTNAWQRFSITFTNPSSGALGYGLTRRGTTSDETLTRCYAWGAQLEQLSYATSYIPTLTGSQEVRATETATGAGSADLINSTEGVLYAEIAALANDGTNRTIALNKDTNDRIQMYFNTSTNGLSIFYKAQSGATSFIMNETLTDATSFNKIAFKWKANDFALWVNGVETDTVSSGVTPTANSLNALEFEMFNDSGPFYGKCKALAVFNEALSDDELNNLTG